MKRIWGHVMSMVVAGLALGSVMPSCATNDQSIFVRGALLPSSNRVNGACVYTNDSQQGELFFGTMDVGLTDSYTSVLIVGNQLIPRGDPNANRAESNRVHVNGGVIRVTETDGRLIREFTSVSTGFADPANNNAPSYAVIGLITFDAPTKDIILNRNGDHPEQMGLPNRSIIKTVLLNIKVFGRSLGGEDLESDEYQFPLQVCKGCLVDIVSGNDPAQMPQPNCKRALPMGTTIPRPCFFGQDEGVSCQSCLGSFPVCDPTIKNP